MPKSAGSPSSTSVSTEFQCPLQRRSGRRERKALRVLFEDMSNESDQQPERLRVLKEQHAAAGTALNKLVRLTDPPKEGRFASPKDTLMADAETRAHHVAHGPNNWPGQHSTGRSPWEGVDRHADVLGYSINDVPDQTTVHGGPRIQPQPDPVSVGEEQQHPSSPNSPAPTVTSAPSDGRVGVGSSRIRRV
jgi:hypothetical protein